MARRLVGGGGTAGFQAHVVGHFGQQMILYLFRLLLHFRLARAVRLPLMMHRVKFFFVVAVGLEVLKRRVIFVVITHDGCPFLSFASVLSSRRSSRCPGG